MLRRLLLLVVVVMMASPVSADVILRVDFNSEQDGGGNSTTAGDPGASAAAHNQADWSSYHANHEVAAEFATANYGGITVTPAWPNTTDNRVQQSLDRGAGNDNNWDNSLGYLNLVTDWIGTDTRTANGGKGNWDGTTGTPTYMTLTLGGLAVGSYEWTSFHHDTEHAHGSFAVWLSTDGGTTFIQLADGLMTDGTTGGTPDSGTVYGGPDPYSLPSTYRTTFIANGVDNVVLRFAPYSNAAGVHRQLWGMNGFELNRVKSPAAIALTPLNGSDDVLRDGTILSWKPGEGAVAHDVYLGMTHDEVDDGMTTSASYKGREDVNNFDPGRLVLGQTYYWRVDEVAADGTITKSRVWNFTVEPVSIALGGDRVTATASSFALNADPNLNSDPNSTIDGSGLSADDIPLHSIDVTQMWLSDAAGPEPAWIQYEFDQVYKLHQMWVWNYNGEGLNTVYGFKGLAIEYSVDGVNWVPLDGVTELPQGPGAAAYVPNVIDFGGAAAKYVKLTANSNWSNGWFKQSGLSEVRFMVIPTFAREPVPTSGTTDVSPQQLTLSWRAGRDVARHNVYLSDDEDKVLDGTALVATVPTPSLDISALVTLGKTYYWRIDEVNEVEDPSVWQGDLWSFTVQSFRPVDDFESYENEAFKEIWATWLDGTEFGTNDPTNGSTVGLDPAAGDYSVAPGRAGGQSLPIWFTNTAAAPKSEATCTSAFGDWTAHGIKSLSLWFYGDPANGGGQLYVKINDTKVPYDGDAANLTEAIWQPFNIDLSKVGGILSNVTKLAVGVEGIGAKGVLRIDDIRLYPEPAELVVPTEPSADGLVAYLSFDEGAGTTAADSSGNGNHGTVMGDAQWVTGKVRGALAFDGVDDIVAVTQTSGLPIYNNGTDNAYTVAMWVKGGPQNDKRVFSEGSTTDNNPLLNLGTHNSATPTGQFAAYIRPDTGTAATLNHPLSQAEPFDDTWHHITWVDENGTARFYVDGHIDGGNFNYTRGTMALNTTTVGGILRAAPSYFFTGQIDEVRIYNRALSQAEAAWLAGKTMPSHKAF